ncbi:hypothetical protein IG631_08160 [Alternaria alternata]|nr:hypothetical protein IG631_08160 [Alternaria alternata]
MISGSGSVSKLLWVATGRHESYTLKFPRRLQPRTHHVRNRYSLASITDWKDRGLNPLLRLSNLLTPCRVSTSHRSFSPSTTYTRKPLLQSQDGLPKPPRPSASTSKRKTKNGRSQNRSRKRVRRGEANRKRQVEAVAQYINLECRILYRWQKRSQKLENKQSLRSWFPLLHASTSVAPFRHVEKYLSDTRRKSMEIRKVICGTNTLSRFLRTPSHLPNRFSERADQNLHETTFPILLRRACRLAIALRD